MLIEELQHRSAELAGIIMSAETALDNAPEGLLRGSTSNGNTQYYRRRDTSDKNGTYIDRANTTLPAELAQKEYAHRVLTLARMQKQAIDNLLHNAKWGLEQHAIMEIPSKMSASKHALITPYEVTDDEFANTWQNQDYVRKHFADDAPNYRTEKGERVRSKSEIIIANKLFMAGVPYHYEKPLELPHLTTLHPDFTVLNKRTRREYLWEHLGMMDTPEYCMQALERIARYSESGYHPGINLIITHETSRHPLDTAAVERVIEAHLL